MLGLVGVEGIFLNQEILLRGSLSLPCLANIVRCVGIFKVGYLILYGSIELWNLLAIEYINFNLKWKFFADNVRVASGKI